MFAGRHVLHEVTGLATVIMMETPIPDIDQKPSVIDRMTTAVKAAGKRVVDQYRSDSVVTAWGQAVERVVEGYHPEFTKDQIAERAKRFHLLAQGMGAAASAMDLTLSVVGIWKGGKNLLDIRRFNPMKIEEGSGVQVIAPSQSESTQRRVIARHQMFLSLPSFGVAAGATFLRPARFFLELMGKGASLGGEKVGSIMRRITSGT